MPQNALELKAFYDSPAGHKHCRVVRGKISALWPHVTKEKIIGFGFTLPYLPMFSESNQTLAIMPPQMGALDLHQGMASVMATEDMLPIRNEVIDRIITAHALENAADLQALMFEFWRVLKPYGRTLLIFDCKIVDADKIKAIVLANRFSILSSKKIGLFSNIQIIEAQKLVFAPRGRTQKTTKSILDKLFKPKLAEPTSA